MAAIPHYHGCFTLLYGDPEVREQQQYLQPLYGLTAEDDPPIVQRRRVSSQDASMDSASSSDLNSTTTTDDDVHDDLLNAQRISIPGEPAVRGHKHPRISSDFPPASTGREGDDNEDNDDEGEGEGRGRTPAHNRRGGGNEEGSSTRSGGPANASAVAVVARPPRRINRVELGLYAELCSGVVGPQPVYGGVAVQRDPSAQRLSPSTPQDPARPYLFNTSGAPLLSSIIDADALQRLQEARKPYPAPQPRSGHVLLPYPPRGSLILYGGLGDDPFNDVWEYSTTTGRWTKLDCTAEDEETDGATTPIAAAAAAGNADSSPASQQQQQQQNTASAARDEERNNSNNNSNHTHDNDNSDVVAPGPNESMAAFIARLQAQHGFTAGDSEDDDDEEGEDVDGDDDVEDGDGDGSDVQAGHRRGNMPPPAYGQAASMYVDENGDTCMVVLGGITVGDVCVHGFFSLNVATQKWRKLETTMKTKDMWGATAQTLHAPRRYPRPPNAASGPSEPAQAMETEEEQVVVLFGGMTAMGEVIDPTTHILHLDHRLTAAEVAANESLFLNSLNYTQREHDRVMRRVMREEDAAAKAEDGAPTDDNQSVSVGVRCARWRVAHADLLARWRQRALRDLEGKYWTETIPASGSLHGRRRPTSAAFGRHFMYIFGGRDDLYFYNDLWCLNMVTRTWVQVRDGIPPHLLRRFLTQPHNPIYGVQLNDRGAQLRRRTVAAVEAKLLQNASNTPTNATVSSMVRNREVHHALFSSSVNSTARARTGACMVVDMRRECLYLYGGFSYTGQQHLTFFDLHAYYIKENVWRRVAICHGRPWDATLDAAQDAVTLVNPCEEARPYPRHARPAMASLERRPSSFSSTATPTPAASSLPPTIMAYATRHLRPRSSTPTTVRSVTPPDAPPAPPVVRRGQRGSDNNNNNNYGDGSARHHVDSADHFRLPTFIPEARTMAVMAEDPLHPGERFFLHGGRSGEEACGDFFELRTGASRTVDVEYGKTQRAARLEAQTTAAAAAAQRANNSPTSTSGRPSPISATPAASASASTIAPSASTGGPVFVPAASTAAAAATSAAAASAGSSADANRLQLRNRRQLQRQLISAALELQEEFEDAPAAHSITIAEAAPLLRHSLRDKATEWIRDGLAAVEPKSLMFVELRNGHAVVNLRTHIHYSSRLSLLANSEQRVEDSVGNRSCATTAAVVRPGGAYAPSPAASSTLASSAPPSRRTLADTSQPRRASSPASLVTLQLMESFDGHLKRSALSLEILLYDVLLSKPMCNTNTAGGEGMLMTSPCTHGAILSTSPENYAPFPSCPPSGNSPGTSPGASTPLPSSPHVQIVSRAQYSTPRTPQPLSVPVSGAQLPSQPESADAQTREHRTPSPALTRRSSSFCSSNGTGFPAQQQQPTNNEYDYHILLRSLFHHEPYYRTFGASDKKR